MAAPRHGIGGWRVGGAETILPPLWVSFCASGAVGGFIGGANYALMYWHFLNTTEMPCRSPSPVVGLIVQESEMPKLILFTRGVYLALTDFFFSAVARWQVGVGRGRWFQPPSGLAVFATLSV